MVGNPMDILRWFLRKDSHAQCYIRDICQATPASRQDGNFFWYLGTVPFRVARFVGIVIGIKIYDRRSLYFVDDGTATIQCIYLHPIVKNRVPVDNLRHPCSMFPPPVEPFCDVGATVHIVGRVESWRDTRQITIDDIGLCNSGEEIKHWIETSHLHKTYYCKPFIIPRLAIIGTEVSNNPQGHMTLCHNVDSCASYPSLSRLAAKSCSAEPTVSSPAANLTLTDTMINSSIYTSVSEILSTSAIRSEDELLRLRHPSRLRSKELSKNVFKIYLKNYMDIVSHDSVRAHRENLDINSFFFCKSSPLKGFRLSYLRRIPELCALCKLVLASNTASSDHAERSSVKKTFIWAIRELIKEGTVVLHDKNGPVWETLNHNTPIWRIPQNNNDTKTSKSKSGIMKNSTNFLRHAEDEGEISDPPSKEESYIPLIPEVLCLSIVNILKESTQPKQLQSRSGLSLREIRDHLNQDMRWEYVGDYIITDSLALLETTGRVRQVQSGRWKFQ